MFLKKPAKLVWTKHAQFKMKFYGLSEGRVKRVLHSPKRVEEGVAPKTIAAMGPASMKFVTPKTGGARKETWSQEIWVMVQDSAAGRMVISAWRYPGITKPRSELINTILQGEYDDYSAQK